MPRDAQGNAVSAASENAVRAFDHAVQGFLTYRADTAQRLGPMLAADPEFGMAHVLKGCLSMAPFDAAFLPRAREALAEARACLSRAGTGRERAHAAALSAWVEGEIDRALAVWEDDPGRAPARRARLPPAPLQRLLARPAGADAGRRSSGCCRTGRPTCRAGARCSPAAPSPTRNAATTSWPRRPAATRIALDPGDLWAAHAVAHVLEMQGRRGEGIAWLDGLERHWEGANNLAHHLWWHRAMYHLERREFDAVLGLYDRRFRDLASPLTQAQPDLYIDVQNAASMLFRLELRGVAVGDRWMELADKAEARIGDWLSRLHPAALDDGAGRHRALGGGGADAGGDARGGAARRRNRAGPVAPVLRDAAVPVCEAVLAHRRGDFAGAVAAMRPALGAMHRLGGSHAQQDVLEQLFLDAAVRGRGGGGCAAAAGARGGPASGAAGAAHRLCRGGAAGCALRGRRSEREHAAFAAPCRLDQGWDHSPRAGRLR